VDWIQVAQDRDKWRALRFNKRRGISWPPALLTPPGPICSYENGILTMCHCIIDMVGSLFRGKRIKIVRLTQALNLISYQRAMRDEKVFFECPKYIM